MENYALLGIHWTLIWRRQKRKKKKESKKKKSHQLRNKYEPHSRKNSKGKFIVKFTNTNCTAPNFLLSSDLLQIAPLEEEEIKSVKENDGKGKQNIAVEIFFFPLLEFFVGKGIKEGGL